MNLNILVRGQSNAILMMELDGWAGYGALESEVERLLGFDGVADKVSLIYRPHDLNEGTAFGGTALVGDWLTPRNGDWRQGWDIGAQERAILNAASRLPADQRDDPTAVLWLHSEYDSANRDLTVEQWMAAVRFDAAQLRGALGQGAATTPYLFISAMPYWGTEEGHQAIRLGMERLAADAGFNAAIAARMQDINATTDNWDNNWSTIEYGGGHIDAGDAAQTVLRAARGIAEAFSAYAKPGSAAAGNIADLGPQVVSAAALGGNELRVDVRHDAAGGFRALDADAAAGVGWSVRGPGGVVWGTGARIEDGDTLRLSFSGPLPADGVLFYGHGNGRLGGAAGEGRGNAVHDDQGMPIWVAADGLKVGAAVAVPAPVTSGLLRTGTAGADSLGGGAGADTLAGGDGNDILRGGAGDDMLRGGAGNDVLRGDAGNDILATGAGIDRVLWGVGAGADRVTDFTLGADRIGLSGTTADAVTATAGASGLTLILASGETLLLEGLGMATAKQLGIAGVFRAAPAPSGQNVAGTAGDDWLRGGNGADTLTGGAGSDDLQGLDGDDLLRGGRDHDGLTGGGGRDTFAFARGDGADWIVDFQPGVEKLRLEGITAGQVTQTVEARWGMTGLELAFGGGDEVFLQGVGARLAAGDLIFA